MIYLYLYLFIKERNYASGIKVLLCPLGNTVHLVKHKSVFPGLYTLMVKISDKQGTFVLQNLSVAACDCSVSPSCLVQRNMQKTVGSGVVGTAIFASLLVLGEHCILGL